jgi:putative PIN family toxin of toxin-antitoxin system
LNRFVLDANILLAALAGRPDAPPALLLAGVHNGDLEAVACPLLIEEIRNNLEKPYFRAKLSEQEAREAIDAFSAIALMRANPADVEAILRDADDDYLVALAGESQADAIVTGDGDLLDHTGLGLKRSTLGLLATALGWASRDDSVGSQHPPRLPVEDVRSLKNRLATPRRASALLVGEPVFEHGLGEADVSSDA